MFEPMAVELLHAAGLRMADQTKIVLIEDDREISNTLQRVLEAAGYTLSVANNGQDGRRQIESFGPDLVITDMMMPKMGGFPVLEFLKEMPDETRPKVIMVTANEGGRHKAYAEMLGVDDYIRKPFAMDVLLDAIERILGKPAPTARRKPKASGGAGPIQRRSGN
ncbi:MAG: DNA-binding response OmpR family regulator [Planctomycetaceae bacterium]|jgi:DNA-binding response OmpR family regulator